MYQERVYTHMGTLDVSVCVNCGNVVDDVILFNRIILPLKLEGLFGRPQLFTAKEQSAQR